MSSTRRRPPTRCGSWACAPRRARVRARARPLPAAHAHATAISLSYSRATSDRFSAQRIETGLQFHPLVRVERADRIGEDEGPELVRDHMACSRRPRIAARPVAIRVFTVPSGTPNGSRARGGYSPRSTPSMSAFAGREAGQRRPHAAGRLGPPTASRACRRARPPPNEAHRQRHGLRVQPRRSPGRGGAQTVDGAISRMASATGGRPRQRVV